MRKYCIFWGEFSHDGELFNYTVLPGTSPENVVERFRKKRDREHKYIPPDDTVYYVTPYTEVVEVKIVEHKTYSTETSTVMVR